MFDKNSKINFENTLKSNIQYLVNIDIEGLVRKNELGEIYSFEKARKYFEDIKKYGILLKQCPVFELPERRLDSLNQRIHGLIEKLENINRYDPKIDNRVSRDSLIDQLDVEYTDFLDNIMPLISFLTTHPDTLESIKENATDIIKSMEFMQNETIEKKKTALENADKMLKELKDLSAESGITKYNAIFAEEAQGNKKQAIYWLIATVIIGAISLYIAYLFLDLRPKEENPSAYVIVQFSITKIISFSVLYYLLVLFVRNYNAHRHNYVINKHRQNALQTFSTFVSSATDSDTKNAVLLQATQSIFSYQMSGYLKNESEIDNPNKFIEIIKNVSSQKT